MNTDQPTPYEPEIDETSEVPETKPPGFLRRFFSLKTLKWIAIDLLMVVLFIVIVYAIADLRGYWAWKNYVDLAKARNVKLNWKEFIPPPIPDDQNFVAIPMFKAIYDYIPGTSKVRDTNALFFQEQRRRADEAIISNKFGCRLKYSDNWRSGKVVNLNDWLAPLDNNPLPNSKHSEPELLATFEESLLNLDEIVNELHEASVRPKARYQVFYTEFILDTLLPHLPAVKNLSKKLYGRSVVHLRTNKADQAFEEIQIMFRLTESLQNEPFLASQLSKQSCRNDIINATWEGLRLHRWSEPNLSWLQRHFENINSVVEMKHSFQAECACNLQSIDFLKPNINDIPFFAITDEFSLDRGINAILIRCIPWGWWQYEKLTLCSWYDQYNLPTNDPKDLPSHLRFISIIDQDVDQDLPGNNGEIIHDVLKASLALWNHTMMQQIFTRSVKKSWNKAANDQCALHMATIACALERHRILHGKYPASLKEIDPAIITAPPLDLFSAKPFHYKLLPDGRFQLYSVGPNLVDDGGKVEFSSSGRVNINQGDWVWEYPAEKP